MHQYRRFRITLSILACLLLQTQGADKYTDEKRPYEFGFNVEVEGTKQQHRHEKKDKDGLIMGEFGFITADNVYHVTVYATDKEGRFKILSMKNIHLKSSPAPAGPALSARQGHSLALPSAVPASAPAASASAPAAPPAAPGSVPSTPFKQIVLQPPGRSCSSCSIPTTTTRAPPAAPAYNYPPQNQQAFPASAPFAPNNLQPNGFGNQPYNPQVSQPNYSQQGPAIPASAQPIPQQPGQLQQNYPPQSALSPPFGPNVAQPNQQIGSPQSFPNGPSVGIPQPGAPQYSNTPAQNPNTQDGGRTAKQYTGPQQQFNTNLGPQSPGQGQQSPVKPTLVSAQMQIVDKNTDIHALRPGEQPGLPAGLSKNDMTQLLYTFNYTVGFHGHFEEGYTNGVKKGYYFVTGRNGIRTRIDYVADDTGFHPKVSQDVLDLLSDEVPKPETEKDEKYGLKGYEFKWLYYPVDLNKQ